MEVYQIQMIVRAVRLIAMHRLVYSVYINRMLTCVQGKPLVFLVGLAILRVIGVALNQRQENIRWHVEVNVL